MPALCDGEVTAEGIIYMNAWPQVRRRIGTINHCNQSGENIFSRENKGPQMMSVWPQRRNEEKNCHPGKKKSAAFKVVVLILQEEKRDSGSDINEPQ